MLSSLSLPTIHFGGLDRFVGSKKGLSPEQPCVKHTEHAASSPDDFSSDDSPTDLNSYFRYRPKSHFIAPHSWMNDPCGIVFVEETKDYILCYQWNPGTSEGGNCAWGAARSKDLVTWVDSPPALRNGTETKYDSKGVFSGSIISRLVNGHRTLYLFYTSISRLPIHWSTPYLEGCETQSVAISRDFGRSWHRSAQNPLLDRPPLLERTTGWRDPHIGPWLSLSKLRGVEPNRQYMMLASGDRNTGPQLRLYESSNLTDWQQLCVILQGQADSPISSGSELIWGRNFECASFCTLGNTDFIIAGMELHPSTNCRHSSRYTIWMSGQLKIKQGKPRFHITAHGMLDSGIFYAPHVFQGSAGDSLLSGWVDEDENNTTKDQAWAGCLAHPRELYELRLPSLHTDSQHLWHHDAASSTMTTLGVRPAKELSKLRTGSKHYSLQTLGSMCSQNFEIVAIFHNLLGNETFTFNVRQAPNDQEITRIVISIPRNEIAIDRSRSSMSNGNPISETGHFQLLRSEGQSGVENLHVRIYVDNSLLELYANDRFALSSRIYPTLESAKGVSYSFTRGDTDFDVRNVTLDCWEGLLDAWPAREKPTSQGHLAKKLSTVDTVEI